MYRWSKKRESIMDLNIPKEKVNTTSAGTSNVSAVSTSAKNDNNSILTGKKPKEELLKQLGLTTEQYLKICRENPNFETLPLEKQLEYIKNNAQNSIQTEFQAVDKKDSQNSLNSSQDVSQTGNDSETSAQVQDEESPFFNKAEYAKLSKNEKMNVYIEEYAKNSFMFADKDNPKTAEEWNALTDDEKARYLNDAKTGLKDKFAEVLKSTSDNIVNFALDGMMTDLLVANHNNMRVKQFYGEEEYGGYKYEQRHREEDIYSYLNEVELIEKDINCPSSLSQIDKARLQKERLLAQAVGDITGDENMCPSDARTYLERNNLSEYDVEFMYLNKKSSEGKLSDYEKAHLEELKNLLDNDTFQTALQESKYQGLQRLKAEREEAVKNGDSTRLDALDKVINSEESKKLEKIYENRDKKTVETPQEFNDFKDSAFGKLYANTTDSSAKAGIMLAYLNDSVPAEKRAEVAAKLSQGLEAEGPEGLATNIKFLEAGLAIKNYAKTIAKDSNVNRVNLANNNNIKNGKEPDAGTLQIIQARNKDAFKTSKTDQEKNEYKNVIIDSNKVIEKHGSNQSKAVTVNSYAELSYDDEIGISLNDVNYSNTDFELQRQGFDKINPDASDNVKTHGALNAYKALEGNQNYSLEQYTKGSKAATKAAAEDGTYTKFAESEQVAGMNTTNQRIEENFEGQEKIDLLVKSADYIKDAAVSNQLEMHKIVMTSEYDEVLQHASSNINKYHESVQADAIRASYETGNQKAIDAVNSQLDLCSKAAVESVAEVNTMLAKTEQSSNEQVVQMVSNLNSDYKSVTGNDIEVYGSDGLISNIVTEFQYAVENNDTQRQIQLLGKIPTNMLSTAISQLSMQNVNLLSTFVKLGRGAELLKIPGMSSDVTNKVIHLMLNSSLKDQKFAAKYVVENKNYFSKSTLERCQELLTSSKNTYQSAPMGGVKMSLQPGMSAIYPDKKEMFYKA